MSRQFQQKGGGGQVSNNEAVHKTAICTPRRPAVATTERAAGRIDLLSALRACEQSITALVDADRPTTTDWLNVITARNLARMAIEEHTTNANNT